MQKQIVLSTRPGQEISIFNISFNLADFLRIALEGANIESNSFLLLGGEGY